VIGRALVARVRGRRPAPDGPHGAVPSVVRGWSNRPIYRERDGRGLWRSGALVLVLALVTLPGGFYLLEQNDCLELTYEISALRAEQDRLEEAERRLRATRATLESLATIERWAADEQTLVHPSPAEVVVVPARSTSPAGWLARDHAPGERPALVSR
jgi:hypothetical protein